MTDERIDKPIQTEFPLTIKWSVYFNNDNDWVNFALKHNLEIRTTFPPRKTGRKNNPTRVIVCENVNKYAPSI